MNQHQIISTLITALTDLEFKQIGASIAGQGKENNKIYKVFKEIAKNATVDQESIVRKIYGEVSKSSQDSYRKLCERLLNKLCMLLSENSAFVQDEINYSEIFRTRQYVRRQSTMISLLILKGLPINWIKKELNKLIRICEEYEFFDEEITIQRQLISFYYREEDEMNVLKCKSRINVVSRYLEFFNNSELYIYRYISKVQYKSIDDKSLLVGMKEALAEVDKYYQESSSNLILYQKLMLDLQIAHYEEDFRKAEMVLFEIIQVTEIYPGVRSKGRIAINYMNLAYTQFFLYKFDDAFENSKKASKVFLEQSYNLNIYREASVFALIYLKRYGEAGEILQQILDSGTLGNVPEQLSKRHCMMAVIQYLQGNYKQSFLHLQETKEVESDREGWNLGIRIMNIYLTLSTEKVDLADQRIGSMRKHIERTARMRHLRKRDVVIFRILSQLSRSGFDFKEVWEDRRKDFNLLRSGHSEYRWLPRSHELIIFDQWFEAKMKGVPYDPVFPAPLHTGNASENNYPESAKIKAGNV